VEDDALRFHLPILDVHFVATEDDRDVLADADQIAMPVGHVLVGYTRGHVEHDDSALALDVVAIAQTSELLLAGGVPHVEADGASIGVENQRVHLHSKCGHVLLFELAGHVTLDEGRLSGAAIADEHALECGYILTFLSHPARTIDHCVCVYSGLFWTLAAEQWAVVCGLRSRLDWLVL